MVANALDRFARDDPDQVSRWVQFGRSPLARGPGESSSDGHRRESDAELPSLGVATDSGLSPTLPCDGPRLSRYSDRPSSANELARHSLTKVRLRLVVLTSVVQVVRLAREEQQAALLSSSLSILRYVLSLVVLRHPCARVRDAVRCHVWSGDDRDRDRPTVTVGQQRAASAPTALGSLPRPPSQRIFTVM